MENVDLNNTYWEKLSGFPTEHRVDARWILKQTQSQKPCGSLRVVSHPDLPPGHLRAVFTYMVTVRNKSREEKIQTVEDYQVDHDELEVYSISEDIKTDQTKLEAPLSEIEETFGVKIFNKN
jgi:hypothetical protein